MIVHGLDLTNFRGFEHAEFTFNPGVNIIAGVNGAGKSSVLDALRITLSRAISKDYKTKDQPVGHSRSDFRYGASFWTLIVRYSLTTGPSPFEFLAHVNLEENLTVNTTEVRHGTVVRPTQFEFLKIGKLVLDSHPVCIYFSPHRTLVENRTLPIEAGGEAVRAGAFAPRALNIWHLSQWWLAQMALANEIPAARARSELIRHTLLTFLPEFKNVKPIGGEQPDLIFTKGRSMLSASQLSDGERGVISLVLELARRFSLAFPQDEAPFLTRSGCVMIDEIELHLHPTWQRDIIGKLERTFPKCQFIITTHSPQVVGEVPHERIWFIPESGAPYHPDRSLGLDTSRVIEELMGGGSRNSATEAKLHRLAELVDRGELEHAKEALQSLENQLGENDPDVIRASGLIDFLEAPIDPD